MKLLEINMSLYMKKTWTILLHINEPNFTVELQRQLAVVLAALVAWDNTEVMCLIWHLCYQLAFPEFKMRVLHNSKIQ